VQEGAAPSAARAASLLLQWRAEEGGPEAARQPRDGDRLARPPATGALRAPRHLEQHARLVGRLPLGRPRADLSQQLVRALVPLGGPRRFAVPAILARGLRRHATASAALQPPPQLAHATAGKAAGEAAGEGLTAPAPRRRRPLPAAGAVATGLLRYGVRCLGETRLTMLAQSSLHII